MDEEEFCCHACGYRCAPNADEILIEYVCPRCDHDNSQDSDDVE